MSELEQPGLEQAPSGDASPAGGNSLCHSASPKFASPCVSTCAPRARPGTSPGIRSLPPLFQPLPAGSISAPANPSAGGLLPAFSSFPPHPHLTHLWSHNLFWPIVTRVSTVVATEWHLHCLLCPLALLQLPSQIDRGGTVSHALSQNPEEKRSRHGAPSSCIPGAHTWQCGVVWVEPGCFLDAQTSPK